MEKRIVRIRGGGHVARQKTGRKEGRKVGI